MKHVRFKGPMGLPSQTRRVLTPANLEKLGVDVPDSLLEDGNLVFGPKNYHTIEMSDAASDSLVEALPNEFVVVDEDEVDQQLVMPMTVATSQKGARKAGNDETDADGDSSDAK